MTQWTEKDIPDLRGKTALVTGANRGLGYEIATVLAGKGADVLLACRDAKKADAAAARIRERHAQAHLKTLALDVADLASVRRFAQQCQASTGKIDLLFHNAAAILVPAGKTRDGFEMHLGTNHFGPFALTGLLLPQLAIDARVINFSSLAHRMTAGLDLDDLPLAKRTYKDMDAYGRSKLAALLFTFELARRLKAAGSEIKAVAAHPGYSATNPDQGGFGLRLATRLFAQAAAAGALPALRAATDPEANSGDYYGPGGFKELGGAPRKVECSEQARDAALAARLWEVSEQLTGVRYLSA